jgi:ADP-ribose pyrophosphatase
MRTAFKEWAAIVDALGSGRQILILRKGGISEGHGGFQVEYPEFFLFPTQFHQQRDSVLPEAQARFDQLKFPPPEILRVEFFCRVAQWRRLPSLDDAKRLEGQHVWKPEVIAERFEWGRNKEIFALAVRTYRLPAPIDLPMLPSYGGCKSWIELEKDIDISGALPVLNDAEFSKRLKELSSSLDSTEARHQRETLYQGKYLALLKEGHWEYADRVGATGAAIILAVTPEEKLLVVEQFRIPARARTIELPAGIIGDEGENESDAEAARRELLEETGYQASHIEELMKGPTSSGLTSETVTLFLAKNLKRIHAGGGVANEKITVHEVPLKNVNQWLDQKRAEGCLIDPKLYAGLYFLSPRTA